MNNQALPRTIPVDAEHSGLRVAVVIVFLLAALAGYIALNVIISSEGINLIAILGSFLIAYGITALVERILKKRWPSGREVQIDENGVRMVRKGAVQQEIRANAPAATLMWHFQTKRRSRVPKGWHVLACALEQDERYLSVYTFMSPNQFKDFEHAARFTRLQARSKTNDRKGGGCDDLLLAGEQRRLLQAENERWQTGAEMTIDDFQAYLDALALVFPQRMREW